MSVSMETSSLEAIHKELKSMNKRLATIEDLIEEVIVKDLPKVKLSKKEQRAIKKTIAEMKRGERVKLEELSA